MLPVNSAIIKSTIDTALIYKYKYNTGIS